MKTLIGEREEAQAERDLAHVYNFPDNSAEINYIMQKVFNSANKVI